MSTNSGWFNGVKQKVERVLSGDVFPVNRNLCYSSHERLPPRLNFRGISIAARVVGLEIGDFTKRKTGKDLASLRESESRKRVLQKLSDIRVAVTNDNTKYGLLTLACDHSSNFTTTLSPEGPECAGSDSDF